MPKRTPFRVPRDGGLTDIEPLSRGRGVASERLGRLNAGQIAAIERTVRRTPEVMVKVSGGGKDVGGAQAHFAYIDRHGKLEVHTDDGQVLQGKEVAEQLVDDWQLETVAGQYRAKPLGGRQAKIVHNVILSMPGPTPADKVLAAAQKFAREKFGLQHRYAMVLHTDRKHPHVHLVVKAESEEGKRLYIRKATLREWREHFAQCMREQGVAANATPNAIRGRNKSTRPDGIYRAAERNASTFMRRKVEGIARQLKIGRLIPQPGQAQLVQTRDQVMAGWLGTAEALRREGRQDLASDIETFARALPRTATDQEQIALRLLAQVGAQRGATDRSRYPSPKRQGE